MIVSNRLSDPIASNALGQALFPHLFPERQAPLNQAVYMFLDPRARTFYSDWETIARATVSTIRLAAGHDPHDEALTRLVGRLATQSEEFRTWWAGHTVRLHLTGNKGINHPIVGPIELQDDVMELPAAPGMHVTSYLAAPGTADADLLDLLRSWIAEPRPGATSVAADAPSDRS
ncbi:hypothetical protein ACIBL3_45925 [Kribbella sp. NPDC050124]|uniref:MmyB family transcriptional regulator n=1 Tax=Kribbella sp. NPDC050124 TaxID=3364114 RepID=UPI0037B278E0